MPRLADIVRSISSINHKPLSIFISHAWDFHSEYLRLVELLYSIKDFKWHNCTGYQCGLIPEDIDMFHDYLPGLLKDQIRSAHCVLIITDIYMDNEYWIQKEIDIALELNKPVIAIKSQFFTPVPAIIEQAAKEIVEWTPESISSAIRKHCKL